jgi:RCC1 and BTB domain-containing protein
MMGVQSFGPDYNISGFLFSGNLGNEAVVVTKSDEVFAIGSNAAGCLGLGDLQSTLYPKKVEALCNKNVKGMKHNIGLWLGLL